MNKIKKLCIGLIMVVLFVCTSCAKDDYKLSVIAPSGAPAMALGELAVEKGSQYTIELNKSADALKSVFISQESDVIVAPINLGAQLYLQNEAYQLVSVLTWGNLYFASQKSDFKLEDLNQSVVTLFGSGTINDVIVKYVLESKGITIHEDSTYLGNTNLTNSVLLENPNAIVLVAEPALSTAKARNSQIQSISVQELYKEVSGSNSYPQAGCFVKKATIEEHKSVVETFIDDLEASSNLCKNQPSEAANYAVQLELGTNADILASAIPNCNIQFVSALDAKIDIEKMVALQSKMFGGSNPVDGFYYA